MNQHEFTRRSFLTGFAATGALAAAGLAGCAPSGSGANTGNAGNSGSTSAFASSETTKTTLNNAPASIAETKEVDVAIVGAGGSGVACALEAVNQGLSVLCIDQQDSAGGATKFGIDWIFALGDQYHEHVGLNIITPEELVSHELANSQYRADGSRWLSLVKQSADNIDWIVENGGTISEFTDIDPTVMAETVINIPEAETQLAPLNIKGGANAGCVTPLSKAAESAGAEFMYNTTATGLIAGEDGTVTGLYAEGKSGTIQINAKAVVLATGGISCNEDLLLKAGWDVEQTVQCGTGYNNGDGYTFALDAGGQDRLGEGAPMGQWVIDAFDGRVWNDPITGDNGLTQMAKQILINQNCKRFTAEDVPLKNPIMQVNITKNNLATYSIFDDAIFSEHFALYEGAASDLQAAVAKKSSLIKCDSVADAAKAFGLEEDALQETLDTYNASCEAGHDSEFAKKADYLQKIEPPFYIGKVLNGMEVYIGGLNTSSNYEVLDPDYKPIPGLYAVGVDGCTLYRNMYTVTVGSGTFAHSIFSGRVAAQAIAESLK